MKKYLAIVNSELITPARMGIQGADLRHPVETFLKVFRHFASDSLYRNSIYLMLSTAIMAFFGFFFWIIVARLYTPEQVGIATTLISVLGLISGLSTLGLNIGLIRFLPKSVVKNEKINSSFTLTIIASILISVIFLSGLKLFSPKLLFLQENLYYILSFILFALILSLNTIVESIFVAYRSAKFTLIKNLFLSITKTALPIMLVGFSAYGIFASVGIASALAFMLSVGLLIYFFKYQPAFSISISAIKKIGSYSFGNYAAAFIGSLPATILPLLITNILGAKHTAYFYIAFMVASLINMIPQATAQTLLAESSYSDKNMKIHILKSLKITSLMLFPFIILIFLFGKNILDAFGNNYSREALPLLKLFAISSIFNSINGIIASIFRLRNMVKELIVISFYTMFIILFLSLLLVNLQLLGIGLAWLLGQVAVFIIYLIILSRLKFI